MSGHVFGNEIKTHQALPPGPTPRPATRNLLLMTATPHTGKEDDFQLFLALLDGDRFEGRFRRWASTRSTRRIVMRRMVKEELLTFDGTPLFPERRAAHRPVRAVTPREHTSTRAVTDYVRER